jgi:hypothetical protein
VPNTKPSPDEQPAIIKTKDTNAKCIDPIILYSSTFSAPLGN